MNQPCLASTEINAVDSLDDLPFRFREDLAFLSRQQCGDLIDTCARNRGGPREDAAAFRSGNSLPHRPRGLGGSDCRKGLGILGGREFSDDLS